MCIDNYLTQYSKPRQNYISINIFSFEDKKKIVCEKSQSGLKPKA